MPKRMVALWFRSLLSDWLIIRRPGLKNIPFVFTGTDRGRIVITEASITAQEAGIRSGMPAADAKAFVPGLVVLDDKPGRQEKLLKGLAEWCVRYSPIVAVDPPDGLVLDVSGCTHLWGAESAYLNEIVSRLKSKGYLVRAAMADTVGAAWAISRFRQTGTVIEPGMQA